MHLYAERRATDAQREQVYEYIMNDPARFEILIEIMRQKAMQELGLAPEDDFLPAHLECCSPSEFAMSAAFSEYRRKVSAAAPAMPAPTPACFISGHEFDRGSLGLVSASRRTGRRESLFDVLRKALLED